MEYIRVIIHIKRVWLAVRFNCKLSFIIRNELSQKIGEIDNTYSLFKGECLVNQTMYFELPLDVVANRCKKLKLIVMMISANGMVPAGFINFNTHPKTPYEHFQAIMPIERCQDSKAQIKFMHMYEHCHKTPIQNSYITHLLTKQDHHGYENGAGYVKGNQKNSHSVNRENVSARKYRQRQSYLQTNIQKVSFSKPLVSPRTLYKHIQGSQTQKSIKIHQFQNKIAEQKQLNQSSINPLTKQQLMKQHQQYWLQIIRLEQEVQTLKQQNIKSNQMNNILKNQSKELKEYYQGHQEKIHAFIGEIQQNSQTIKKLQLQLQQQKIQIQQQKYIISLKQQFERESQNLRETQSNQLRESLHKHADLEQVLKNTKQQNKALNVQHEIDTQKIIFLQNETKKYVSENLLIKQKLLDCQNQIELLSSSNQIYKENIKNHQNKIAEQKSQIQSLILDLQQINTIQNQLQTYKLQSLRNKQKISTLENEISENIQEKQRLIQESSQKDEEALLAFAKNAQLIKELAQLKTLHENEKQESQIHESKIKIYEQELNFSSKEKQELLFELRRKDQTISELKSKLDQLEQQNKIVRIKIIEYQASLSGKNSHIQNLKIQLQEKKQEITQLFDKHMNQEHQFEEMHSVLATQADQKNKITILFTTLEENYKSLEKDCSSLKEKIEVIRKENDGLKSDQEKNRASYQQILLQLSQSNSQLSLTKTQLSQSLDKITYLQLELQSSLQKLQQQKNNMRNQYQQTYNQSMTSLMLKYGKLEKQLEQINLLLSKETNQKDSLLEKYNLKENQLLEVKKFTHNKLTENLKLMKENQQQRSKNSSIDAKLEKYQQQIQSKNKVIDQLKAYNQENLVKIDQLTNELQFVTEILQRERQQKSDIEKDLDHFDKSDQLAQIVQAAHLKEESFDQIKLGEVNLEIESKVFSNDQYGKDQASGSMKNKNKK